MDINQVKTDFENGTLICRATMAKVIDMAMVAASCNAKNEKTIVRLHAELEASRAAPDGAVLAALLNLDSAVHTVLIAGGDYGDDLSDTHLRKALSDAQLVGYRALIGAGIEKVSYSVNPLRVFVKDAPAAPAPCHPDDFAVDHFAGAMKAKMADSRVKGRSGWNDPMQCTAGFLRQLLVKAVRKGDPVDVGNFAMMLHARGTTTMLPSLTDDIDKQIAIVDAQRHQRLERRLQNVPVELERRAGYDRRARVVEPKG